MPNETEHVLQILLTEARSGDEVAGAFLRSTAARELCVQAGVAHAGLMQSLDDGTETVQLAERDWQTIADRYMLEG